MLPKISSVASVSPAIRWDTFSASARTSKYQNRRHQPERHHFSLAHHLGVRTQSSSLWKRTPKRSPWRESACVAPLQGELAISSQAQHNSQLCCSTIKGRSLCSLSSQLSPQLDLVSLWSPMSLMTKFCKTSLLGLGKMAYVCKSSILGLGIRKVKHLPRWSAASNQSFGDFRCCSEKGC